MKRYLLKFLSVFFKTNVHIAHFKKSALCLLSHNKDVQYLWWPIIACFLCNTSELGCSQFVELNINLVCELLRYRI